MLIYEGSESTFTAGGPQGPDAVGLERKELTIGAVDYIDRWICSGIAGDRGGTARELLCHRGLLKSRYEARRGIISRKAHRWSLAEDTEMGGEHFYVELIKKGLDTTTT